MLQFLTNMEKKLHYFYNSSELTDFTQTFQEYGIGDKAIIDVEECSHELCSKCCKCISGMKKEKNELNKRLNDEMPFSCSTTIISSGSNLSTNSIECVAIINCFSSAT